MNDNDRPNLEAAWATLLQRHPELGNLPDQSDRKPPNEESLDQLLEQGQPDPPPPSSDEFKAFVEWVAETRGRLDEPDRTIFNLLLQGLTHQQIGDKINRTRVCVTGRFRKIMALANGQFRAADFRVFADLLQLGCRLNQCSMPQLLDAWARGEADGG